MQAQVIGALSAGTLLIDETARAAAMTVGAFPGTPYRANPGFSIGNPSTVETSVPEPASLSLLALVLPVIAAQCRGRSST